MSSATSPPSFSNPDVDGCKDETAALKASLQNALQAEETARKAANAALADASEARKDADDATEMAEEALRDADKARMDLEYAQSQLDEADNRAKEAEHFADVEHARAESWKEDAEQWKQRAQDALSVAGKAFFKVWVSSFITGSELIIPPTPSFDKDVAVGFAAALQYCPDGLTILDLQGNNIGNDGMSAISGALSLDPMKNIEVLTLDNIGIDGSGAHQIAQSFKHMPTLKVLSLSKNRIGGSGATTLIEPLMDHPDELKALILNDCDIGPNGATAILLKLEEVKPKHLIILSLGGNSIRDTGAGAIGHALLSLSPIWRKCTCIQMASRFGAPLFLFRNSDLSRARVY